jgi:hypothetical protein
MPVLRPGAGGPILAINPKSPAAKLTPAGVADLLVIRQHIKGYELGEVSHIENVLKGESKKRTTRSARTTDQTFTTVQETTSTEQRDLQTTERFELKQEMSSTVKDDFSLKTGVAMSVSYGGMLEIKTDLNFALDHSQEQTTKTASTYAKDVSNRAASQVTQRVLQSQTRRVIETFEDTNEHAIDNSQGGGPVIGVYQWVDKVYEEQLFQLSGKRLMFDFMVPEPAAFLLRGFERPAQGLQKPELLAIDQPRALKPWDITRDNFGDYASLYEVVIPAPPRPKVTVSATLEDQLDLHKAVTATKTATIQIPDGYCADTGICQFTALGDPGFDYENQHVPWAPQIVVNIGNQSFHSPKDWDPRDFNVPNSSSSDPGKFQKEVDKLSVAVQASFFLAYTVSIEVTCVTTDRAEQEWQLNAYAAVVQAYLKRLGDYEDKLAAKAIQSTGQPSGGNPDENRAIERTELKKGCISLLTRQLENLDAIQDDPPAGDNPNPIPQIDFQLPDATGVLAQGAYIRFFEQAFEWEQMMYFFYPYFWGREENWFNRAMLRDDDPLFAEFLKAGEARVVVPVRQWFEPAILHFLDTGEIWNGGDVPKIGSSLYVSIIQEIEDSQKDPEMTLLDHWEVTVPTTLVKLRPDGSLPSWKYENGNWTAA